MKQTLFTLFMLFLSAYTLNAQCSSCTRPLASTYGGVNGFYPNPAVFTQGVYDDIIIDVVFPKDTVAFGQTVRFTSWKVTAVNNIPAGLSYTIGEGKQLGDTILPPNANTPATLCFSICGTATTPNVISDSVSLSVTASTSLGITQSATVKYRVQVDQATSADKFTENAGFNIYPQPVTQVSLLSLGQENSGRKSDVIIEILDIGGKIIKTETTTGNTFPIGSALQNQPNGMYIVRVKTDGVISAQKIIKQD